MLVILNLLVAIGVLFTVFVFWIEPPPSPPHEGSTLVLLLHAFLIAFLVFLIAVEDPAHPRLPKDGYPKRNQREWRILFFGLMTALGVSTTVITYSGLPRYFDVPALSIGLRREQVLISIPSRYISAAALCMRQQRGESDRGQQREKDRVELVATLIFHGLGKRSLVEFDDGVCPPLTLRIRRIVVPYDEVIILNDTTTSGTKAPTT